MLSDDYIFFIFFFFLLFLIDESLLEIALEENYFFFGTISIFEFVMENACNI